MTIFPITNMRQLERSYNMWKQSCQEISLSTCTAFFWHTLKKAAPAIPIGIAAYHFSSRFIHLISPNAGRLIAEIALSSIHPIIGVTLEVLLKKEGFYKHLSLYQETHSSKELVFVIRDLYVIVNSFYQVLVQFESQFKRVSILKTPSKVPDLKDMASYLREQQLTQGDYLMLRKALERVQFPDEYSIKEAVICGCAVVDQKALKKIWDKNISHEKKITKVAQLLRQWKTQTNQQTLKSSEPASSLPLILTRIFKVALLVVAVMNSIKYQGYLQTAFCFTVGFIVNEVSLQHLFNQINAEQIPNPQNEGKKITVIETFPQDQLNMIASILMIRKEETDLYTTPSLSQVIRQIWSLSTQMIIANHARHSTFSLLFGCSLGQTAASYWMDIITKSSF
ncbi:MAG: hypothetical protein QRY72_02405 [Candidatus Rhabdochlamydia sp.]